MKRLLIIGSHDMVASNSIFVEPISQLKSEDWQAVVERRRSVVPVSSLSDRRILTYFILVDLSTG